MDVVGTGVSVVRGPIEAALRRGRPQGPELAATVITDVPVLGYYARHIKPFCDPSFTILDVPAASLTLFSVSIVNTGSVPLEASQYIRPITLSLGPEPIALCQMSAHYRRSDQLHPDDDPIKLDQKGTEITVRPAILNQQDALVITGVVAQVDRLKIRISVRYPGLDEVQMVQFRADGAEETFTNIDAVAKETSWVHLRKLAPRRWKYRRASQLRDLIDELLLWSAERQAKAEDD